MQVMINQAPEHLLYKKLRVCCFLSDILPPPLRVFGPKSFQDSGDQVAVNFISRTRSASRARVILLCHLIHKVLRAIILAHH